MRVINSSGEDIEAYDLENGYFLDSVAIKKDAKPIDNITKFGYCESDYESVKMFVSVPIGERIDELKGKLRETDYVVLKIAEGAAVADEYADVIEKRKEWRKEINKLESQITASDGNV